MSQAWSKTMSEGRVLTVELDEVSEPGPLFPGESRADAPLALARISYPGSLTQRYSSLEKARRILTNRGFRPSDQLVYAPSHVDDEPPPRRAV
jgi:hypothetical protein